MEQFKSRSVTKSTTLEPLRAVLIVPPHYIRQDTGQDSGDDANSINLDFVRIVIFFADSLSLRQGSSANKRAEKNSLYRRLRFSGINSYRN